MGTHDKALVKTFFKWSAVWFCIFTFLFIAHPLGRVGGVLFFYWGALYNLVVRTVFVVTGTWWLNEDHGVGLKELIVWILIAAIPPAIAFGSVAAVGTIFKKKPTSSTGNSRS